MEESKFNRVMRTKGSCVKVLIEYKMVKIIFLHLITETKNRLKKSD